MGHGRHGRGCKRGGDGPLRGPGDGYGVAREQHK